MYQRNITTTCSAYFFLKVSLIIKRKIQIYFSTFIYVVTNNYFAKCLVMYFYSFMVRNLKV